MNMPVLTIDGPSGSGKGTISRVIAKKLGWHYLDSGSIYRSLAIAVNQRNIGLEDKQSVVGIAEAMQLSFQCSEEKLLVFLDGEEISQQLGTEQTGHSASVLAAYPEVREVLLQKQRDFQKMPGLVADGRDMGTVVFPAATCKVFLTANAEERAQRRYKQLKEKGIDANLLQIIDDIEKRDLRDRTRKTAPLKAAEGALYIDSSELSIEQVSEKILEWVNTG